MPEPPPRAYPSGLGKSLEQLYRQELGQPIRGDLRLNQTPRDKSMSQRDLFLAMPGGDMWRDADLLGVFDYLYCSKATRTVLIRLWFNPVLQDSQRMARCDGSIQIGVAGSGALLKEIAKKSELFRSFDAGGRRGLIRNCKNSESELRTRLVSVSELFPLVAVEIRRRNPCAISRNSRAISRNRAQL